MESTHDGNDDGARADGPYGSTGTRDMDINFSEKDIDQKNVGQYHSEEEPSDTGTERGGRRVNPSGTWGSSFWKDCQPMWGANEDDYDSKKVEEGSEYDSKKGEEGSPDDSLEESNDQGDGEHFQKGQADVPAEEMLSDDYYEQDEDDPDDVDFEPDFGEINSRSRSKAKMSDSDDFEDEDDEEDVEFDLSEEDEVEFTSVKQQRPRRKIGQTSKAAKENKVNQFSRRKRVEICQTRQNHLKMTLKRIVMNT
ncbi:hypothetical protein HPP92_006458 [Vanilla planifolia]|uniref:Uncharacterized protein n=1 Tax=Vanilla planifolia TaxID=51239 RepID=A0A835VAA9_VANPL|nr:hypothetical protein HPP92_006458 [Vanilla planifolia]